MAGVESGHSRLCGGLGGLLKVPRGNSQLWLLLDQPVCKFGWIKAARSAKHEARNLTLLSHAIYRFLRLPKHLSYFFHRKQTGERVESGQDVKRDIKWGITPRRDELIFQKRISVRWPGFGLVPRGAPRSTVLAPSGVCPHQREAWGPSLDLPAFHKTIANDNGGHPWRLSIQLFLGFRRNSKTRAVGLARIG